MYSRSDLLNDIGGIFRELDGNTVDIPEIGPTLLFEAPVTGFAAASDGLFEKFREAEVIGPVFMGPYEWLPEAKTVISLFFPFSEAVRTSNRESRIKPSKQWLYARIEGQDFLNRFMRSLQSRLSEEGVDSCVPSLDERFGVRIETTAEGDGPGFHVDSKWSERHAAYACGLGTFGLSRGLITVKGMAGRFASIIADADFGSDERKYQGVYDYCIRCGKCADNCPARAISLEHGKNNVKCNQYVEAMKKLYSPRYGCGKCQVGVPCSEAIPDYLK